jgi:septum formation protein
MKLILASASPRRAEILHSAGLQFSVLSSAVDETPIPSESPQELVRRLAFAKAELVAARALGPAIIIAADTVVVLEGAILGKPRTSEEARQMLEKLSGRTHSVMTGVAAIRLPVSERRECIETTQVHFASISKR